MPGQDDGTQKRSVPSWKKKFVTILNEMAEYLSIAQMKKLQEVLLKKIWRLQKAEISNAEYLQNFRKVIQQQAQSIRLA